MAFPVGAAWGIGEFAGSLIAGYLAEPLSPAGALSFMQAAALTSPGAPLPSSSLRNRPGAPRKSRSRELIAQGTEHKGKDPPVRPETYVLHQKINVLKLPPRGIPGSLPQGILPLLPHRLLRAVQGFSKGKWHYHLLPLPFGVGATIGASRRLKDQVVQKAPRYMPSSWPAAPSCRNHPHPCSSST